MRICARGKTSHLQSGHETITFKALSVARQIELKLCQSLVKNYHQQFLTMEGSKSKSNQNLGSERTTTTTTTEQ
jgi:hypothetical protein